MKTGAMEAVLVTLNNNISFMGKTWWVFTVTLRLSSLLLSGFTLFYDEQDQFVCNTIQPGCTNVCFDVFSPLSLFHFWLLQLLSLSLPHLLFLTYVTHRVLSSQSVRAPRRSSERTRTSSLSTLRPTPSSETHLGVAPPSLPPAGWSSASYPCASFLDSSARVLLEAAFVAAQLYLYGLSVPRSFLCYEAPCVSGVACYTSRPTEKTLMMIFMLGVASLSFLLGLIDLACSLRRVAGRKRKREVLNEEELSRGEQNIVFMGNGVLEDKTAPNGGEGLWRGVDDRATPAAAADSSVNAVVPQAPRIHLVGLGGASIARGRVLREGGRSAASAFSYVLHDDTPSPSPQRDRRTAPGPGVIITTPTGNKRLGQYASMVGTGEEQHSDSSGIQDKRAYV
ncbi:gap junction delta-4 protein-like [Hypomesus transpacificus]|uniref:gap junction delta-4 protein-like n=1 Tax=Hypomesus transpacificus TaxID=137520 RepID=UPI001F0773AF|nr:gap junction delta-4 protein-like [Hypomesus transpacificus]